MDKNWRLNLRTVIVLAMHGSPPLDFPRGELAEFFGLHMRLELASVPEEQRDVLSERHDYLGRKMAEWPRSETNDPFYAASMMLASDLGRAAGCDVFTGFNEFCAPSLDEALERACTSGAVCVVVVTPMMTGGGEHSERDIPEAIDRARARHEGVRIVYAWPFPSKESAAFLAEQARGFFPVARVQDGSGADEEPGGCDSLQ